MKRGFIVAVDLLLKVYKLFEEKYGKEEAEEVVNLLDKTVDSLEEKIEEKIKAKEPILKDEIKKS